MLLGDSWLLGLQKHYKAEVSEYTLTFSKTDLDKKCSLVSRKHNPF